MAAPNVEVNGTQIDTDAVIIDDKTYVPLRGVFEAAGAEVSWNEETQTAGINISNSLSDDELIPSVIESVSPSVVGIIGRGKTESYYGSQEGIMSGSGVIIKTGGEILTNAHVVKNMNTILVVMNDGKVDGFDTHENLLKNNEIYRDVYDSQTNGGGDFDEGGAA